VEVAAGYAGELVRAAVKAHRRMLESASRLTDADCRRPSLLPGWSRGHVLAHWARNADGQSRMLVAAMRGVVTAQYPGGDAQRAAEIEAGAARPARVIFDDARAAISRLEDAWRQMPASAWERPTAARAGTRPAWLSAWARWRETEIHHVDFDNGYTHDQWPAEFTGLLLPRVLPTLQARLADQVTVRAEAADCNLAITAAAPRAAGDLVIVCGPASAILCWLLGRPAAADLTVTRAGQPWTVPRLPPWAGLAPPPAPPRRARRPCHHSGSTATLP